MVGKRSGRPSSPSVLNIEDLRRLACETAPRIVFSYIDGATSGLKRIFVVLALVRSWHLDTPCRTK
jgi:hypothetical protein